MMTRTEDIVEAVFEAIEIVNEQLPPDRRLERSLDTALIGEHGKLDSLGLVNFILAVEECIERKFGIGIVLTDGSALSQQEKVFATVEALGAYIEQLITESDHGQRQA